MSLPADEGLCLIIKAIDNEANDKLYQKWLHDQARYELSFEEYYTAHIPYRKSTQEEKDEILKKYGGGAFGSL